jgi:hypothetical protein
MTTARIKSVICLLIVCCIAPVASADDKQAPTIKSLDQKTVEVRPGNEHAAALLA